MEFEATSILKEAKGDATDVCRELPDTAGVQSVTEQDIKTLGEETAVNNVHNCENDDKQRSDVSQSVTKDSENTEIVVSNIHNSENDDKQRNAVSQSAAKDGDNTEIAVNNVHNSENDDKQRNDLSQSAVKDDQNTERTKRRRRRRRRTNKPTSVDSNTDEVPNETGKSITIVGQEAEDRKISGCNNKKENEISAKRIDPLEKGKQKNIPNQKISNQDQHDQEHLVKTNPRKDLESFLGKKRNYPEKVSNPYRGRGGTNSDSQGRGYIRGINRGRDQAFRPNSNRDSEYDEVRGKGRSDFNRGRGISNSERGRPGFSRGRVTSHFNGGRGMNNFNQVRGRSEFSRSNERKEFNSGNGRPYFNRGRGRGSSYELYKGIASYAKIHAEFKGDSYDTKVNSFADRGRTNGEFNRGRANSYSSNVGSENERVRDNYNRRGSHTADVRDSFVRGRGTGDFNRGRGRQFFQRERGRSYNRIEKQLEQSSVFIED
ncbi:uncharacterized protein DDB_G0283697-like [Artemia franciscana]|uniref:Uncharacterized protein n=1 Tax=Artemia franciscana TaxID=6661 RepID=A0AA88HF30_ARTSF|nr:hypothetical protein QYM36_016610 [Artemia franciscana]